MLICRPAALVLTNRRGAVVAYSAVSPTVLRGDGLGGDGVQMKPSDGKYDAVVIWMHGLGDTAMGWAPAMPSFGISATKFILPTAPEIPITLNGGYEMPGWFDVSGLDPTSPEDRDGFAQSSKRITALIESEVARGIPTSRIVLAGFSQGAAMALHVSLRFRDGDGVGRLGGCVALSGWLPMRGDYPAALGPNAQQLRVLQCHGDADKVVPFAWGKGSYQLLSETLGLQKAQWKAYTGMAHSACDEELADVAAFLKSVLEK